MPSTTISESPLLAENVRSSPSISLADNSSVNDVSSSIVWSTSGSITGRSLTDWIVTVNVVLTVKRETLSLADTVISPWPKAFSTNVNVKVVPSISAVSSSIVSEINKLKLDSFSTS